MDWRKEYDEGYAALRKQTKEGAAFGVCVVPVSAIQNLIEDGNKGNKTAKQIANSLNRWFEMANAAVMETRGLNVAAAVRKLRVMKLRDGLCFFHTNPIIPE